MKKIKVVIGILVAVVLATTGIALAQGPGGILRYPAEVVFSEFENLSRVPKVAIDSSPAIEERVIAPTTSTLKIAALKAMSCSVVHQLQEATALKCPARVASLFNLREDRVFYPIDLEADVQINADDLWADEIDGTGVNVVVLDTGIDTNHPELSGSIVGCETFVEGTATCEDDYGHGTHIAGMITADGEYTSPEGENAKGVAPGAGIYMYKVCGPIGAGYGCYESDMMAAMEAAVLTDAKVMSISIGGGNYKGADCDDDELAAKVNWVVAEGMTVVAAAGNDQFFVSSPACASGAIAVGAVDKDGLMADFSNFGPSLDIVAPGVDIYSSWLTADYYTASGTSMSTPMVSGTVALMLQADPSLTVAGIKTALYGAATVINPESVCYGVTKHRGKVYWIGEVECSPDNSGAGIVDAYGAVNYAPPVCGNEIIEGTEECDLTDLGEATCGSLGFSGGTLACSAESCTFDTRGCTAPTCTVVPGECNCNGKCAKNEASTCGDCL